MFRGKERENHISRSTKLKLTLEDKDIITFIKNVLILTFLKYSEFSLYYEKYFCQSFVKVLDCNLSHALL